MGSVTGSSSKDKNLSENIAAGFGDMTDEQKKKKEEEDAANAAKVLKSPSADDAPSVMEFLGLKKRK